MNDWFSWNGKKCTEYGIHVLEQPPITIPAERATFTNVPGRPGSLTTLEGDDVYDDLILTAQCMISDPSNIRTIATYLKGSGKVAFANRPGGFYSARIVNQIPFEKILRGNPHRSFAVNFRCKPFWYQENVPEITVTTSGTFITNRGSVYSEPVITVYGSGEITLMVGMTIVELDGIGTKQVMMDFYKDGSGIAFGKVAENAGKVEFGWPLLLSEPLGVDQGGTGAETASAACTKLGAVKKAGDTMTGNLSISGYLYPSLYLLPTYNSTTNRTVFEGSYVGASSFSSWEDGTGNNRRMLEVRNAAYQASLDFAVLLRTCTGGTWASYRLFHAGMATPIPLANGGTGANSAKAALANLGIFYSASLPSSGTDGQFCLVPV